MMRPTFACPAYSLLPSATHRALAFLTSGAWLTSLPSLWCVLPPWVNWWFKHCSLHIVCLNRQDSCNKKLGYNVIVKRTAHTPAGSWEIANRIYSSPGSPVPQAIAL